MLHAEEPRKYEVLSELPRQIVELDQKKVIAKGKWVEDNFSKYCQRIQPNTIINYKFNCGILQDYFNHAE